MKYQAPKIRLVSLFVSVAFLLIPAVVNAAALPKTDWTPVTKLTPLPAGPGIVVAEPLGANKKLMNLGAGCARWLHLNVSSNIAFGKTPTWEALATLAQSSHQGNLRLSPTAAKVLFPRLGITRVVTGQIKQINGNISLRWRVWSLPDLKLLGTVASTDSSPDAIVKSLPQTGKKLIHILGGDQKFYEANVIAPTLSAKSLSQLGSVPWQPGYDAPASQIQQLRLMAKKSLLANLFFVTYLRTIRASGFTDYTANLAKTALKRLVATVIESPTGKPPKTNLLAIEYCRWLAHYNLSPAVRIRQSTSQPSTIYSHNYLGTLQQFWAFGATGKHWKTLETAVRLNIKNANAWYKLSMAYSELMNATRRGRVAAALSSQETRYLFKISDQWVLSALKSVTLNKGAGKYWVNLSVAATFDGKDKLAITAMDNSLQLAPNNAGTYSWA